MARVYSVVFEAVAITAAQDLFELTPADDKPVRILGLFLFQTTDLGDAAEEILRLRIRRGNTTGGSGGTAPTPAPLNSSIDTAAGAAAEVNNTTLASTGTAVTLWAGGWNIRQPLELFFTPETCPGASQANTTICVELIAAPADSITTSGCLIFEEPY